GVAATEGQQRQLREDHQQRNQHGGHRASLQVTKMLRGVSTSMVGSKGRRSTAMHTKQASATAMPAQLPRSGLAIFTAIEISSPAAAAASPANRCWMRGSSA